MIPATVRFLSMSCNATEVDIIRYVFGQRLRAKVTVFYAQISISNFK